MKKLAVGDVEFVPASFCSNDGRLFQSNGRLYRALAPERSAFFEGLFREGVIDQLVGEGFLVETTPVDLTLEGFGLVVQHRRVPFVTYPFEWSDQALQDSALLLLRLNLELLRRGLMTHDVHPWNILFEGTAPVFVDLGSIKPAEGIDLGRWVEEFRRFYVRPLGLFRAGQGRIARLCLQDWKDWRGGVLAEDFGRLTEQGLGRRFASQQAARARRAVPAPVRAALRPVRRWLTKPNPHSGATSTPVYDPSVREAALGRLLRDVESTELPQQPYWDYYEELFTFPSFSDAGEWSDKHRGVAQALRTTRPGAVVDIGSNRGWYAQLAAREGSQVLATDKDEALVSQLYRDAKSQALPVQPLVVDFLWPSPGFGLLDFWPPAVERLRCDMAMALALVHHLAHSQGMHFGHIVRGFSRFTDRWLLTEFIPHEDPILSTWYRRKLEWYTLDSFLAELGREFDVIQQMPSDPPTRTLLLCEKRRTA